ncbi:hypothetical protein Ping_1970 [Psychromonas ingrahamii 37]|uniref:Uncharacterized protein n=1 Tax=Psychromonas ingrahamii (strain DSM 17664 / CCUG 51855 / 37) TaxID=357804 RepID=A1SW73_PSYIN|nr:hypothetical protein [Psychromonas ingrahamii]ABM03738.1 hypothetical protein Ping_1970 [Psychromonas ingrahamii 37]
MPQYSLLSELERKVILFNYEKRGQKNSLLSFARLSDDDRSFISTEGDYILWELSKRKFEADEVISHSWIIMSKQNLPLILKFNADHHLRVGSLFDDKTVDGIWGLDGGILSIFFRYEQRNYYIDIIANNKRSIHSALQITDEHSVDLLKVIPLRNEKYGISLIE